MFEYKCKLIKVTDGDTFKVELDLGFRTYIRDSLRLANISAPELKTESGKMLRDLLVDKFANDWDPNNMTVVSNKHGKFRWLGIFKVWDKKTTGYIEINQWLLDEGWATPYQ